MGMGWRKRELWFESARFIPGVLQIWQQPGFPGLPSAPMSPWQCPARHREFLATVHPAFASRDGEPEPEEQPCCWHMSPGCSGSARPARAVPAELRLYSLFYSLLHLEHILQQSHGAEPSSLHPLCCVEQPQGCRLLIYSRIIMLLFLTGLPLQELSICTCLSDGECSPCRVLG